ncbi:hypothetical protein MVES1_000440 [Malassezia vespertilionis]|uniref:Thioesterase domain-containing protein n=1 Tax=Malassezia vespertilionis TaxID=2020962 RepID=A0A2N1JHD3_9BASI|nr:uncharacterized protein MVES1_000440 [Malassezia vespertilionis]PKI85953.1 hypothetical protein MVES_000407 [Malassezia vespertilionis]WFD05114.1 hypothetical protein MVES1_000440 [Malassezia vespertilionis]
MFGIRSIRTQFRAPASLCARPSVALRMLNTPTIPSMETFRAEQAKRRQEIDAAVDAVAALGYPAQSVLQQNVAWGEIDQFRHVNNMHYIRWFESGRMHWLECAKSTLSPKLYSDIATGAGVGFILATNYCRYKRPVNYPDTVLVAQGVLPLERDDRFAIKSAIYSVNQAAVVAEGEQSVVAYDYDRLCKAPMPTEMRQFVEAWAYTGK